MKELLQRFKKEILEHRESKNYDSLVQLIDSKLFEIQQKEEIKKLNLKNYNLKLEIKSMEDFVKVQKLAFSLNCGWHHGSNKPSKKIIEDYEIAPSYLFMGKYLTVGYENDKVYFENHTNKQVSIEELQKLTEKESA